MMARKVLAALAAAVLVAACAGTPGPGDPGYPYNVSGAYSGQFVVEGQAVPATLSLETGAQGAVTGSFRVAQMGITGDITGMLLGDRLTFRATYRNPESGCDGVAEASATVGEGGSSLSGPISVLECGQSMSGSLRFQR